jgi:hypothetical protein
MIRARSQLGSCPFEAPAQSLNGARDPLLQCWRILPQDTRNFFISETTLVAEPNSSPRVLLQLINALCDHCPELKRSDFVIAWRSRIGMIRHLIAGRDARCASPDLPSCIKASVVSNPKEPPPNRGCAGEVSERFVSLNECYLVDIGGGGRVVQA